jgi:sugar lactone lactonase YvrE
MAALVVATPLLAQGGEGFKLKPLQTIMTDEKGGELKYPEGVACDGRSLILADTGNGRLLRYTFQEESLKGGSEIKLPQLTYPLRVQIGGNGSIFVLDGRQHRIVRLNSDATFSGYVEPKGIPGPKEVVPRSFRVDGAGNVWILDIRGERVLQLDVMGNLQRQLELPKEQGYVSDLEVTSAGDILLIDSNSATIYVARKGESAFVRLSQSLRDYMAYPVYLTTGSRGTIYVVDQNSGAIAAIGGDGSFVGRQLAMGTKSGLLSYPGQIAITPGGTVFIADRNNSRLQLFTLGR